MKPRLRLLPLLFVVSGACGLIYEIVWSQLLIRVMGGTTYAVTTVLVAFMAGLGLGSYVGGRLSQRWVNPVRAYAVLELAIGAYALVLPALLKAALPLYKAIYPYVQDAPIQLTLVRFAVSALVLMVPTAMMGATLPLLIQHWVRSGAGVGRAAAWMYGVNTAGAVVGTALAGYVLVPLLGISTTTYIAASLNVLVGLLAFAIGPPGQQTISTREVHQPDDGEPWRLLRPRAVGVTLALFAASGFAGMVYQVVWTRVLIPHLGPHTYSFTCVLTAFILGLALGGMAAARLADRCRNPLYVLGCVEALAALGGLIVAVILDAFPMIVRQIAGRFHHDPRVMLAAQFVAVTAVLFIPTFCMGMVFPLAVRIVAGRAQDAGRSAGRSYLFNTFGTIAGSFVAGFILIPWQRVGLSGAMVIGVGIHAAGALVMLFYGAVDGIRKLPAWPVALAACMLPAYWYAPELDRSEFAQISYLATDPTTTGTSTNIQYYREGVDATVMVNLVDGFKSLVINNKADGSTALSDSTTQLLAGHLPMLLAPDPRDVLVIGWGTGMTVGAVTRYESVRRIDAVEISDAVLGAERVFADVNGDARGDQRVNLIQQDGRNFLLMTDQKYDVIISEPSNPWVAGMANLFTREYYETCREHLAEGGVFLAWMHSYTVDLREFKSILATVAEVMPYVTLWGHRGDFMMVSSNEPIQMPMVRWLERLDRPIIAEDLARIDYHRPEHLLSLYIGDRELIREWTKSARLHTDDHPRAQYSGVWAVLSRTKIEPVISQALGRIAQSPLGVLAVDPDAARQTEILANTDLVRQARQLARQAAERGAADDNLEAARLFWQAHQVWPHDSLIAEELYIAFTRLTLDSSTGDSDEARALVAELTPKLPPPGSQVVEPIIPAREHPDWRGPK